MFEYDDKLLRKGQAAAYLEISVRSLDRLMASKSLPYVKILVLAQATVVTEPETTKTSLH